MGRIPFRLFKYSAVALGRGKSRWPELPELVLRPSVCVPEGTVFLSINPTFHAARASLLNEDIGAAPQQRRTLLESEAVHKAMVVFAFGDLVIYLYVLAVYYHYVTMEERKKEENNTMQKAVHQANLKTKAAAGAKHDFGAELELSEFRAAATKFMEFTTQFFEEHGVSVTSLASDTVVDGGGEKAAVEKASVEKDVVEKAAENRC